MADQVQARLWEQIYRQAPLHLWGSRPIPGAEIACEWVASAGCHRVLDAGCGDGRNLVALSRVACAVVGSDVTRGALCNAALTLREHDATAILAQDDVRQSIFADGSFDMVMCLEVMSHVDDASAAVRELARLVPSGGMVITDVFTENDETRRDDGGSTASAAARQVLSTYYDRAGAEALLNGSGLELLDVNRTSWIDPPHPGIRPTRHRHETWMLIARKR